MEVSKIMIIALIGIPVIFFVLSLVLGTQTNVIGGQEDANTAVESSGENATTIEETASGN